MLTCIVNFDRYTECCDTRTMYYLNTIDEGGETEFLSQRRRIKPEQGRMVIIPAGFTHTDKGHVPLSGAKLILTSWMLFNRAEQIYR